MILKDNVKVIAFDADDTLWENQPYYDDAEGKQSGSANRWLWGLHPVPYDMAA